MPRSTEELRASIELAKAATPGPWECGGVAEISTTFDREVNIFPPDAELTGGYQYGGPVAVVAVSEDTGGESTAEFIKDARNNYAADLTDLLATREEVERLRKALERTLSWLTSYPGGGPMGPDGPYEQARQALAEPTP